MTDVQVKHWKEGDPVGEDEEQVRAQFSIMDAVRVELVPIKEDLEPRVYVVFRNLGSGPDDPIFKGIREMTGARSNNLWYRCLDGGSMEMTMDEGTITLLEQALHFMEEATATH